MRAIAEAGRRRPWRLRPIPEQVKLEVPVPSTPDLDRALETSCGLISNIEQIIGHLGA
jgi:hypothetical protein